MSSDNDQGLCPEAAAAVGTRLLFSVRYNKNPESSGRVHAAAGPAGVNKTRKHGAEHLALSLSLSEAPRGPLPTAP